MAAIPDNRKLPKREADLFKSILVRVNQPLLARLSGVCMQVRASAFLLPSSSRRRLSRLLHAAS